jgi:hypothetical protein
MSEPTQTFAALLAAGPVDSITIEDGSVPGTVTTYSAFAPIGTPHTVANWRCSKTVETTVTTTVTTVTTWLPDVAIPGTNGAGLAALFA